MPVANVHWNGKEIRRDMLGPEWASISAKEAVKSQVLNCMNFVLAEKQKSIIKN